MNNLIQNYELILKTLQENCSNITSFKQIRTPKLSNLELAALDLTAEYMMLNSELQLFRTIKNTCLEDKIERSNYNKRRRKLFHYIENIRQSISAKFRHLSNVFIVDSAPIEICEPCRAKRSNICATDRGYISADYQLDLFNESQIRLTVPTRKNQHNQVEFSSTKRRKRKRIETLISQLDGQFSMNKNFAKTFEGLASRILSKITALTIIQYLNLFVFNRNINSLKINLC